MNMKCICRSTWIYSQFYIFFYGQGLRKKVIYVLVGFYNLINVWICVCIKSTIKSHSLHIKHLVINPVWHGTGHFYLYFFVRSDFVSCIFFKNFQTLLEVKIEIHRVILTPCPAHFKSYKSCPLVALKMSIFLAFRSHARQG